MTKTTETLYVTIHTVTDLLPLWGAPREEGEEVTIEVWAGSEDEVRAELLADCEGQPDGDTYLFSGESEAGNDVTWQIRIAHVFGSRPPGLEKCRVDMVDSCAVCGEASSNEDLNWITTQAEADRHDAKVGDVICDVCAS